MAWAIPTYPDRTLHLSDFDWMDDIEKEELIDEKLSYPEKIMKKLLRGK